MKAVLPLALIGVLAIGTAFAAGGGSSMSGSSSRQSQSSMSKAQHWSADDIKQIQDKLQQQGYKVGNIDGKLGPATQQALRQFQKDKGIQASGKPDQQTLAALDINPSGVQQGQMPSSAGRSRMQGGGTNVPPEATQPSGGEMNH